MQTFLPSTSFTQSAKWLDNKRLGKQRLECADALAMLLGQPAWMSGKQYAYIQRKYKHHPAWQMWKGFEPALIEYGLIICREWIGRGCKDTFLQKIGGYSEMLWGWRYWDYYLANSEYPPWLTEEFASNHRSILLGKVHEKLLTFEDDLGWTKKKLNDYQMALNQVKWYQQFNWSEQPAQRVTINGKMRWPYLWPEVV